MRRIALCLAWLAAGIFGQALAQAGAISPAELTAAIEFYQYRLARAVTKVRTYPAAAREQAITGTTLVEFTVLANGELGSRTVAQSSGHALLDEAALETVARAVPLTEIPVALQNRAFGARIAIAFSIVPH